MTAGDFPANSDPRVRRQYLALNATKNYGYTTWTFWPAQTDTYIGQQITKVLTGQQSPKDFCAGVDSAFQSEFKAGKVPPVPAPAGA
jgi:raffinose/stachyose/melibiose transport system substrate-binding protein